MFRIQSARRDRGASEPRRPGKAARPILFLFETREAPDSLRDVASVSVLGGVYGEDFPVARVGVPDLPAPPPVGPAAESREEPADPPAAPATSEAEETNPPADLRLDDPLSETAFRLSLDDDFAAEGGFVNPFVSPIAAAPVPGDSGGATVGSSQSGPDKPADGGPVVAGDEGKSLSPDSSPAFDTSSTRVPASNFINSQPAMPAAAPVGKGAPTDLSPTAPVPAPSPSFPPTVPEPPTDRAVIRTATGGATVSLDANGHRLEAVEAKSALPLDTGGIDLPLGLFAFNVTDVAPGKVAAVDLRLPAGSDFDAYYKQDPRTGELARFDWDGSTGAVFHGRMVTLYLQDGGRGDADGVANGVIVDPGGPGEGGGGPPPPGGGPGSSSGGAVLEADTEWVYRNDTVTFWAYSTDDPAPEYTLIEWDFAYDGSFDVSGTTGESASSSFSTLGQHRVAARLTSAAGAEVAELTFDVHHLPPEVTGPEDMTVEAGQTAALPISVTTDAGAGVETIEWWVSWDGEEYELDSTLTGLSPSYEFEDIGPYFFWVSVEDEDGEVGEYAFEVYADEATPAGGVTVSGPIDEGDYVQFTVDDVSVTDAVGEVSIYADWTGSGTFDLVDSEEWMGNLETTGEASFWHYYDDGTPDGTYEATVRIENEGGESSEYTVEVEVADVAPTATLTAGQRQTDKAYSGQDVFAIRESESVGFFDIDEPSEADWESEQYHFSVGMDTQEGTGAAPAGGAATTSSQSWIKLPSYEVGRTYLVEGWITDKDGAEFPHQKIYVVVEGTVDGEPAGTGHPRSVVYGTMKVQGEGLPESYNRYGYAPELRKTIGEYETVTVELVPDRSWAIRKQPGEELKYVFSVSATDLRSNATTNLPEVVQDSGTYTLPFGFRDDFRIDIGGGFRVVNVNGVEINGGTYYQVSATTPETTNWFDELANLWAAVQQMTTDFGTQATAVYNAARNHLSDFFDTLSDGFEAAANQIMTDIENGLLLDSLYKWIGGGTFSLPAGFDPTNQSHLIDFALRYAGLTWDRISNVLMQELGDGNVAAISKVADWLGTVTDEQAGQAGSMYQILQHLAGVPEFELDLTALANQAVDALKDQVVKGLEKAAPQLLAKLIPGAGQLVTIARGVQWLLNNRQQLQELFNKLVNEGATALINYDDGAFKNALVDGFRLALPTGMGFLAGQIGLGQLPRDIKKALEFVPMKVEEALHKAIRKVANVVLKGGTKGGKSDGLLNGTEPYEFAYKNKTYQLFATKESTKTFVKLVEKVSGKDYMLKASSFLPSAQDEFAAVQSKAVALSGVKKPTQGPPPKPSVFKDHRTTQQDLTTATIALANEIIAGKCPLVGGCFAAGTKLWTPEGYTEVENLQAGDLIFSRDQHRPNGAVEAKPVEKVFARLTEVVHLHVGSQVVRTTAEHPFYVYGRGWVPVSEIVGGDTILTADSDWTSVEEVFATGEIETVYNVRVADYHTYFVGCDEWRFSVWAHNACVEFEQHQITDGSPEEATYAVPAFEYRSRNRNRVAFTGQAKWRNGGGNVAMVTYSPGTGGQATTPIYASNASTDAEVTALNALMEGRVGPGSPHFRVNVVFTERSMCTECQKFYREHLLQSQVPASGVIVVYYITPLVSGPTGNAALIQDYMQLGFDFPD